MRFVEKGDFAAAIIQLRNAVQKDPKNHDVRFLLGRLRLDLGHPEAAEKELRIALNTRHTDETEILLGRALLDQFKFEDVIRTVSRDALSEEALNEKLLVLAEAHWGLNQPEMNQAIYQQILDHDPDYADARLGFARLYLARSQRELALEEVEALLATSPEFAPGWVFRGELALLQSETAAGLEFFGKAIEVDPGNYRARVNLAWVRLRQGDWHTAAEDAQKAAELRPRDPFAKYILAAVDFAEGYYVEAAEEIRDVEGLLARERPVQLLGALIHIRMGSYAIAERQLNLYFNQRPNDPDVRRLLAFVALKNGNTLLAANTLEPLVASRPDDAAAAQLLTSAYLGLGRHSEASWTLQAILESNASTGEDVLRETFVRLAAVAGVGNWRPEFLLPLMPDDAVTALFPILSLLEEEEIDAARDAVRRLKLRYPDTPFVQTLEGVVLARQGEVYAAQSAFARALEFEPGFLPALDHLDEIDRAAGQTEKIEPRLLRLLEQAPRSETLITRFIRLLSDAKRFDELEEFLAEKRIVMVSSILLARALVVLHLARNKIEKVFQILEEILIVSAEVPADLRYARNMFLELKRPERAIYASKLLQAIQPESVGPLLLRAAAEMQAGKAADATATLEGAWELEPGNKAVARELANLFIALQDPAAAQAVAGRLDPYDRVAAVKLKSNVLFRTGQRELAIEALEEAQRERPVPALARDLFVARLRNGQSETAIQGVRDWLIARPDDLETRFLLANSFMEQASYLEAAEEYQQLLTFAPEDPLVLNNLAWLNHRLSREGALELAAKAYGLSPKTPAIADTYGWLLVQSQKVHEGIKVLRAAAKLASGSQAGLRYRLASALASIGETEEAKGMLLDILGTNRPFKERREAEGLLQKLTES